MSWRDSILSEFGETMGISGLDFSESDVVSFEFESMGTLYIEAQESGVLIYLDRDLPQYEVLGALKKSLKLSHYTQSRGLPIQVGIHETEKVYFCVFLYDEEFSLPNIESVMSILGQQCDVLYS